jgi:hypothetical protein
MAAALLVAEGQTLNRSTGSGMLGVVPTDSPHGASGNGSGAGVGG